MIDKLSRLRQRLAPFKLVILLTLAITIALALTYISVALYTKSGVASLDLSRPGYEQARKQTRQTTNNKNFSANGPINVKAINEFQKLYRSEIEQLSNGSDFADDSLDDDQLRLNPGQPGVE